MKYKIDVFQIPKPTKEMGFEIHFSSFEEKCDSVEAIKKWLDNPPDFVFSDDNPDVIFKVGVWTYTEDFYNSHKAAMCERK